MACWKELFWLPGGLAAASSNLNIVREVYLLYCDESGKSGLRDLSQPFHVLGGLIVHDSNWLGVEQELNARIDALVPPPRDHKWELHMTDMVNSKGMVRRHASTYPRSAL